MFLLTIVFSFYTNAENSDVALKSICGKMASMSIDQCNEYLGKLYSDYFLVSRPNDCGPRTPELKDSDLEIAQSVGAPIYENTCKLRGKACERDAAIWVDGLFKEAQKRPTCLEKNPRDTGVRAKR